MIPIVDDVLNKITMYRLVLYYLLFLLGAAVVLSIFGVLPYNPVYLLMTTGFLVSACWLTNMIFAKTFRVPANVESFFISALILALIITPATSIQDLWFLTWAAVWAMGSKYMLAIHRKHIFNPVAFAVALTALTINQTASWWVGSGPMLPFVLIGGVLVVRKIRRFDLVWSFLTVALLATTCFAMLQRQDLMMTWQQTLLYSPLLFVAFVFITEPMTTPPTRMRQIYYGALVGLLIVPQIHIGSFYLTPELAIVIGNLFSYLVSPKSRLVLRLKERIKIAPDVYDFIFAPTQKLAFAPGQYMEWTLGHDSPDSRGNRRYFTLASSPTESNLRLGVKFYPNSSTFKESMLNMQPTDEIVAAQLAGDFVLPEDRHQKCVFIAGGIGITPFRSMVKYLLDSNRPRSLILLYANKTVDEIVYTDVFDKAARRLGMKTIYTLTDTSKVPAGWKGRVGRIDERMIREEVPDYRHCVFYLSGPNAMVASFEATLLHMHVRKDQIRKDFFPGF